MCFLHYIYSISNQQIGVIPSSRLLVWAAPGGLQPESSPLSRPWSSQPCQKDAGRLLLPTQVCWDSELWCAAPPRCSKDGWSSSGFDQHLSPSEKTFFFFFCDWYSWVISQCICGPKLNYLNYQQAISFSHIPWTLWLVSGKSVPHQWSCTSPQWCQRHSRGLGQSSKCLSVAEKKMNLNWDRYLHRNQAVQASNYHHLSSVHSCRGPCRCVQGCPGFPLGSSGSGS